MVAVQVLLMNYFLLGLHTDQQISNDVLLPDEPLLSGGDCSYGCLQCSPINGCLACKPPYFLYLHRDGSRQTALCTRSCPVGFYKLKRKHKQGFCAKCMIRGCRECSTRHYCSVCKRGLVRHAGRCRKRCPEDTVLSARFPGLCLSAPETVPGKSSNEIELNGTISSWKPTRGYPGSRKPHLHPERGPPPPLPPPPPPPRSPFPPNPTSEEKEVPRRIPSQPTTSVRPPVLQPSEDPSMTRLENTYALYPELPTSSSNESSTTPRPRRRHKKKKRKKKRRKEKDKRRHERNRRRKVRERRRRRRLRNKERRKKSGEEDNVSSTVAPVISVDN